MSKLYCGCKCNERFLEIWTCSDSGWIQKDPLGEDIYLEPLADNGTIGEALLKALAKSRDLSETEEERLMNITTKEWRDLKPDRWLLTPVAAAERFKKWLADAMKAYNYKTKTALLKNMQHVSVENDGKNILFSSLWHLTTDSWGDPDGKTPSVEFTIPSSSSVEVIGAAVKYAIGNCQGKGADFMRDIIFPDGQPTTFDEYLKELNLA